MAGKKFYLFDNPKNLSGINLDLAILEAVTKVHRSDGLDILFLPDSSLLPSADELLSSAVSRQTYNYCLDNRIGAVTFKTPDDIVAYLSDGVIRDAHDSFLYPVVNPRAPRSLDILRKTLEHRGYDVFINSL